MSLGKHLDEAANRLKEASYRIEEAREEAVTLESLRKWLVALTDYAQAAADVQLLNNESVHEKLHVLAEGTGMKARL